MNRERQSIAGPWMGRLIENLFFFKSHVEGKNEWQYIIILSLTDTLDEPLNALEDIGDI